MKKLIIIGCGPKAVAIATKARVLEKLGWQVPEIVILDTHGPGANWDGTNGFTDGNVLLGTTPFEDMGFPYDSQIDSSVDEEMLKYSYVAYLINIGKYAEWVDRGFNPHTHAMFADYLKWVLGKIGKSITIGKVSEISMVGEDWKITYTNKSDKTELIGQGLVITGPGNPYIFPHTANSTKDENRIFNGQNIWQNMQQFKNIQNAKIAVIGAGETSASVVVGLLEVLDNTNQIEIVSKHPILFTRNEHWMEVMYYSKVMNWSELSVTEKTDIMRHADRGTYSVATKKLLDSVENVTMQLGTVEKLEVADNSASVFLTRDKETKKETYDYIVEAIGSDPYSFIELFTDKSVFKNSSKISEKIEKDLSIAGVMPKLHVPGLSAIAQGPGFPNLSCLGLLSERILKSYIKK